MDDDGDQLASAIADAFIPLEAAPFIVLVLLPTGRIAKVNAALRKATGYDDAELVGRMAEDFIDESMAGEMPERLGQIEGDERMAPERLWRFRRKDGRIATIRASSLIVRRPDGQPRYIVSRGTIVDAG